MTAPPRPSHAERAAAFDLAAEAARFDGDFATGINACVECCDRHPPGREALVCVDRAGAVTRHGFGVLRERAARFADLLARRGIGPGDRVAGFLPRTLDLVTVILGTWRAGAVYQPLFTAFGPKAVAYRLAGSGARLVVTDEANRGKLDGIEGLPPVLLAGAELEAALAAADPGFAPVPRRGEDLFQMLFTSGTTGHAKGVPVPLKALMAFAAYMRDAVDLRAGDVFWNIADPGWAYGLYYGITGPLALGHATVLVDQPFSVDGLYRTVADLGVTNLAGAPTAFRALMAAGPQAAAAVKGRLRAVSSAGEPLNPEVIRWFAEHLDVTVHDHYGQTETGMTVNNHHGLEHPVRAGAAGLAMPGYRVAVIDETGNELPPGTPGTLAVDCEASPLYFFPGYWEQARQPFIGRYYPTGDTVEQAADGSIAFVGRNDDVITSSGYRIGPFDVESCLIEHPAVAEAAVVGKPDPQRTEIVKAFVVLRPGHAAGDALAAELAGFVKQRLAAHAYPREIEFMDELPKTPSGKIQRFLLRGGDGAAARAPR
ncbi:AMP-binding protein [Coralloluteibacterium stylophorae]|uniref:AMP-binding protein n=1 Tax=Coralloluteibacterium stylophorae TaxID=1776034 RepID=A0A8J7VVB7_9GAMM|nr:AMP-binding protein [Coralloluteibacterium stylophorae]MBS7456239.1 AMP-binding protein [Coralloluteibacterium stylophorae]